MEELSHFISITQKYLEHTINANKRDDNLFHAYNIMSLNGDSEIAISYLDEMLEGQVAALSSGYLESSETLRLLDALKQSALFRHDQYSYILYPNKNLPRFTVKNTIPTEAVEKSELLKKLLNDGNRRVITKDINNVYHFNGNFNNASSLEDALDQLDRSEYGTLIEQDKYLLLQIFEDVFNHKAFTGRSGTFYGYEGLGSIYWHMVSKLLLAVQECCLKAVHDKESSEVIGRLLEHYYEINEGIGAHKPPKLYGAFPTDPYSHTPAGRGAQQPGMTGQVKEDILSRIGELGVFVVEGQLTFNPCLLRAEEFLTEPKSFRYVDIGGNTKEIQLYRHELAFTYCQVPIIYSMASEDSIEVFNRDGSSKSMKSLTLNSELSQKLFERTDEVEFIKVFIEKSILK